ncbi:hypothetical protein [Ruegeria sp. Ofav3-42]|uniref:hypothetical protein n=1 Tax=Ruegeria sp. Ofav3-42 TaxID=2917759 RepID=UPI001EF5DBC4|nr:hypothetical protein [Ruegeria sp. Ofav3-42]MCG7520536.1 hypothetical protein [Ruegeria sp. Ofav3-42]
MGDPLDEIMARHEAATACGCCCDDDYCAYVDTPKAKGPDKEDLSLPHSAASRRGSVRFLNEHQRV